MDINKTTSTYNKYANYQSVYNKNTEKKDEESVKNKAVDSTAKKSATVKKAVDKNSSRFKNVSEYTSYLQKTYSYFGKSAMVEGVPTSVTVSPAFLQKCMNDPEKAKFLEGNLNAIPESMKLGNSLCAASGGVIVSEHFMIDENGNMTTMTTSRTADSDKADKENNAKKTQEQKIREKRMQERDEAAKLVQQSFEEHWEKHKEILLSSQYGETEGNTDGIFNVYR